MTHTPGPYRAEGPDPFGDYNILHGGNSLAVAAVVSNLREPREVLANARLVAAAPELLAPLQKLVGIYRENLAEHLGKNLANEILAAIAKATGKDHH